MDDNKYNLENVCLSLGSVNILVRVLYYGILKGLELMNIYTVHTKFFLIGKKLWLGF